MWFGFVELGGCRLGLRTNELREGWNREGKKREKTFSPPAFFNLFMDALLPLVTGLEGGGVVRLQYSMYDECCAGY